MSRERLQKILAQSGVASRRAAEKLIVDGHVRVNGRIIRELGTKANLNRDRVEVDGKRLVAEKPVYYLMHKPRGVVTTLDDPEGRKNISDLVKQVPARLFPVGRLDFQTSGALLLTNDGAMAQALLHPTRAVPKIYSVKLQGKLDERGIEALRTGVVLDDGEKTGPAQVSVTRIEDKFMFFDITISEGKNRQIHRMCEAIGRRVLRLTRISFAGLSLENLRPGGMRPLLPSELSELKQKYMGLGKHDSPKRPAAPRPRPHTDAFTEVEDVGPKHPTFDPVAARAREPRPVRAVRKPSPDRKKLRDAALAEYDRNAATREKPKRGAPSRGTVSRAAPSRVTPSRATPSRATPSRATPARKTPVRTTPSRGAPTRGPRRGTR